MNLFEWKPIYFGKSSSHYFPKHCSHGLTKITLLLLLPLGIVGFFSTEWQIAYQLLPIYLGLFILGMPHGGADHLLIWGMIRNNGFIFRMSVLLLYPILSMIYLAWWHYQTLFSAVFFLFLTIFHWGQGDQYISVKIHRAYYLERSHLLKLLHILSRGCLPILLPGYLGNETYQSFLETIIRQVSSLEYNLSLIQRFSYFFLLIPLILTTTQLILSGLQLKKDEKKAFQLDCLESLFLFLWFLIIPPLWALGIYFSLWHSLRHSLRILWVDIIGKKHLIERSYFKLKRRWLQISSLMTIFALIGLWGWLSLPLSLQSVEMDWLGKAMLGIAVLTLPHTIVVCLMDFLQLKPREDQNKQFHKKR